MKIQGYVLLAGLVCGCARPTPIIIGSCINAINQTDTVNTIDTSKLDGKTYYHTIGPCKWFLSYKNMDSDQNREITFATNFEINTGGIDDSHYLGVNFCYPGEAQRYSGGCYINPFVDPDRVSMDLNKDLLDQCKNSSKDN